MSAALNLHPTAQKRPIDRRRTPRHRSRGIGTTTGEAISTTSSAGPQGPDGRLLELAAQVARIYRDHEAVTEGMFGIKFDSQENQRLEDWSDRLIAEEREVMTEIAGLPATTSTGFLAKAMALLAAWPRKHDGSFDCDQERPQEQVQLDVLRFVAGI